MYRHTKVKKSYTIIAYALVLGAAFFVGGGLLTGNWGLFAPAAPGAGGVATGVAGTGAATQLGATGLALANVGVYAIGSTMGSGSNLTSPQDGFAGFIGFDPEELTSGSEADTTSWSQHQAGVISANVNRHTANSILSADALRSAKALAQGNCDVGASAAQCAAAGQDAGMAPRADTYQSGDTYNTLREKYAWCQSQGKTGADLRRCASPTTNPATVN